jgi:hypothetical protein
MAVVSKRKKRTAARHHAPRRRRVSGTAAVGKTRRKRRVSGTAAVGKTRRKRRSVSGTGAKGLMKQVVPMAVGMAAGVGAQHFLLRPLEAKIAARFPMAAKFMSVGEIILGGFIALKAKNPIIKGAGLGIMAGGVQSGVKQLNIYHENPAVQGVGDYTTIQVPINGQLREMMSGMMENNVTKTSLIAGDDMGRHHHRHDGFTNAELNRQRVLVGIYGLEDGMGESEADNYLPYKGKQYFD